MVLQRVCLFMLLLVSISEVHGQVKIFNVKSYGAVADGNTDNSQAFLKAWNDACKWKGATRVWVPAGTYKVDPVIFLGPCNGPISFIITGVIKASNDSSSLNIDHWISFRYIDGMTLAGGGVFDGQGASAWPYNNCNKTLKCMTLPVSIRFDFVTNSRINHITSINSKNSHMNIFACKALKLNNIRLTAPENSPNTDGIHIGISSDLQISDSHIGTGDDCISFSPGSKNISIFNVHCGPGHGISIGSLGGNPNEDPVSGLSVKNCTFNGTQNGLRIKTWAPSSSNTVFNLTYEHIYMENVFNPIFIDQHYCPSRNCDPKAASQIEIRDVKFKDIWGSSSSKLAVNLQCSSSKPCQKIELNDINLTYNNKGHEGGPTTSSCSNVHGVSYGEQKPPSCQKIELNDINLTYNNKGHEGGPTTSSCSNVHGVSYGEQKPPSCL